MPLYPVINIASMRKVESYAIEVLGISEEYMMKHAGENSALIIDNYIIKSKDKSILVLIGPGNNGGDGLICANKLASLGYKIDLFYVYKNKKNIPLHSQINIINSFRNINIENYDYIIDAIFGIGKLREFDQDLNQLINKINDSKKIVVSLDVPTGIQLVIDKKNVIKASYTIAMGALKEENVNSPYKYFNGKLFIADIGVDSKLFEKEKLFEYYIDSQDDSLFDLEFNVHKYSRGKALLIGGSKGMCGAITLATLSALQFAGAVKTITPSCCEVALEQFALEATKKYVEADYLTFKNFDDIINELAWADVILIGNGLSKNRQSLLLAQRVVDYVEAKFKNKRLVIDGDGIKAIGENLKKIKNNIIVFTPHSGELKYLLEKSNTSCENFVKKYNVYLVAKSENTFVFTPKEETILNNYGGIELSKFGSGDVLAGMLAGGLSLKKDVLLTINKILYIYGFVANSVAKQKGYINFLARDIINNLDKYNFNKGSYLYA